MSNTAVNYTGPATGTSQNEQTEELFKFFTIHSHQRSHSSLTVTHIHQRELLARATVRQIDQIDHDLDHLDPSLPL